MTWFPSTSSLLRSPRSRRPEDDFFKLIEDDVKEPE